MIETDHAILTLGCITLTRDYISIVTDNNSEETFSCIFLRDISVISISYYRYLSLLLLSVASPIVGACFEILGKESCATLMGVGIGLLFLIFYFLSKIHYITFIAHSGFVIREALKGNIESAKTFITAVIEAKEACNRRNYSEIIKG